MCVKRACAAVLGYLTGAFAKRRGRAPTPIVAVSVSGLVAFEEVGNLPKIGALNSTIVKTLGLFWPLAREGAETVYPFEKSFVVDGGEYRRAFGGYEATPYHEGIRQAIDWYRRGSVRVKLAGSGTRQRQLPRDHVGTKL